MSPADTLNPGSRETASSTSTEPSDAASSSAATSDAAPSSAAASGAASSGPKRPGLRERKRRELRGRIQRAAFDLMLEHGFADVTVEMICESAEVSRRTFFNYFGSKEVVVIGGDPGPIPDRLQDRFVEGTGSILVDLARMLLAMMTTKPRDVDPAMWRSRLELIRSDATLAKALADKVAAKNHDLEELVARRIRLRYGASGTPPGGDGAPGGPAVDALIARQTGFIVAMWWGIARYAIQTSVGNPDIDDRELIESLLDTLTLIQEAEL
ncbi:TetR/AcrR family transcriptional regulator [Brachybacterium subflavum]|uniref:TetR/AcrR family transcriptional regulator n=1 Tax=Brachybacterium subflavum TaxID=2585206 RepID=UPI00187A0E69|nr:TetR/AcrR family transcriptional regulator [Brachybacterium subflavum]